MSIRIGYAPYSADWRAASDRRRLVHWARLRGHSIENFREGGDYDLVALGALSDLPRFARMSRGRAKLLFDLSDSYLDLDPWSVRSLVRGPAKYALGAHSHLEWSFDSALRRMCERADAVVCSTPEQRLQILPHCANVFPILDFHGETGAAFKRDFDPHAPFRLFWEGQGANVATLGLIAEALRLFGARRSIELHVVTDREYRRWNGPLASAPTRRLIDRVLPGVRTWLYDWNPAALAAIAVSCDLGVIPMPRKRMYWSKAENKLLLLWRLGLPTLASATPAYARTMKQAGIEMTCTEESDWSDAFARFGDDAPGRARAAELGRVFAETHHGEAAVAARWDTMVASLGLTV